MMPRFLTRLVPVLALLLATGCAEEGEHDPLVDEPAQTGDVNETARLAVFNFYAYLSNSEPAEACNLVDQSFVAQNTPAQDCESYLSRKLGQDPNKYLSPNVPESAVEEQTGDRARIVVAQIGQNKKNPFKSSDSPYRDNTGVISLARTADGWLITASDTRDQR